MALTGASPPAPICLCTTRSAGLQGDDMAHLGCQRLRKQSRMGALEELPVSYSPFIMSLYFLSPQSQLALPPLLFNPTLI